MSYQQQNFQGSYPPYDSAESYYTDYNQGLQPPLPPGSFEQDQMGMNYQMPVEPYTDDPVAKVVAQNTFGGQVTMQAGPGGNYRAKLNMKKPKPVKTQVFRCESCAIEFSGQVVLDSHMAGARHKRKVATDECFATISALTTDFERDPLNGNIRCTICDITVNSPQLFQAHWNGGKHQRKVAKRKLTESAGDDETSGKKIKSNPDNAEEGAAETSNGTSGDATDGADPADATLKSEVIEEVAGTESSELPSCIVRNGKNYVCTTCQAFCNSDQQLQQHIVSRKHVDKLSGRTNANPRHRPGLGGQGGRGRGKKAAAMAVTQPLSESFVAGEANL